MAYDKNRCWWKNQHLKLVTNIFCLQNLSPSSIKSKFNYQTNPKKDIFQIQINPLFSVFLSPDLSNQFLQSAACVDQLHWAVVVGGYWRYHDTILYSRAVICFVAHILKCTTFSKFLFLFLSFRISSGFVQFKACWLFHLAKI